MRKLLLLLGAARYPFRPDLALSAFPRACAAFKSTMTGGKNPIVAPGDCLDLFDDDGAWADQQRRIADWLAVKRKEPNRAQALLLYYVGHGGIERGGAQVYLTINSSTVHDPYFSSIPRDSLANLLSLPANTFRKYLIVDCCFAAEIVRYMQSPVASKMTLELREVGKANRKSKSGGFAALCASSSLATASADGREGLTQFTDALLSALRTGDPGGTRDLTFEDVRNLLEAELDSRYGADAVAPSSYFADDVFEPIHRLPLFPNHAKNDGVQAPRAQPLAKAAKPKASAVPAERVGDIKQCTSNPLHYFPVDYPNSECPLRDGGRLVPQAL